MNLSELLKQRADLERQIALATSATRAKAIQDVRALMVEHGLTHADLTASPKGRPKPDSAGTKRPVAVKYRDVQGNQWSGRGLRPKWLTAALATGRAIEEFLV